VWRLRPVVTKWCARLRCDPFRPATRFLPLRVCGQTRTGASIASTLAGTPAASSGPGAPEAGAASTYTRRRPRVPPVSPGPARDQPPRRSDSAEGSTCGRGPAGPPPSFVLRAPGDVPEQDKVLLRRRPSLARPIALRKSLATRLAARPLPRLQDLLSPPVPRTLGGASYRGHDSTVRARTREHPRSISGSVVKFRSRSHGDERLSLARYEPSTLISRWRSASALLWPLCR
jgi:hypothetical protein